MAPEHNDRRFLKKNIANKYPQLTPRKYDYIAVGRTDKNNVPMEWNETWWCKVEEFKVMYRRFTEMEENKK